MTDVPKIVHNRLRAAEPPPQTQAHPDADLLIGLAEQALSISERNGVLEHLALCGDCRDAVILALPAETAVALSPMETEADRAAYHEAVWFPHQLFLGTTGDVDAIADAIGKVLTNIEELRGLDHKAIRNQKLGRADRES